MYKQTRRIRYGGKKRKSPTRKRVYRKKNISRRRRKSRGKKAFNVNSWGLNKGTSKGCLRVCLGSTLR